MKHLLSSDGKQADYENMTQRNETKRILILRRLVRKRNEYYIIILKVTVRFRLTLYETAVN